MISCNIKDVCEGEVHMMEMAGFAVSELFICGSAGDIRFVLKNRCCECEADFYFCVVGIIHKLINLILIGDPTKIIFANVLLERNNWLILLT